MVDLPITPPLEPGVLQLWHAPIAAVECDLSAILSAEERSRAERFVFEANRREFVIGRALVRLVLARNLGVSPRELQFRAGRYGKPDLDCGGALPQIRFNVSHSAGLVVAAFSLDGEIGVDVEETERFISPAVMRQVFTARERDQIASLPLSERRAAAAARCTLKEAYLKARGAGLNLPLLGFAFDRPATGQASISFSDLIDDDPARWRFAQSRARPRHVVSLALLDSRSIVSHHDFASLLNLQASHERSREPLVAVG
jgi:4'-phosphopantetheinyl transferase